MQHRLREAPSKSAASQPNLVWATYKPASIVGICFMADGESWVAVDAAGTLHLWRDDTPLQSWQLSTAGTPRSVAAHPEQFQVAVAIKQGGTGTASSVVIADLPG